MRQIHDVIQDVVDTDARDTRSEEQGSQRVSREQSDVLRVVVWLARHGGDHEAARHPHGLSHRVCRIIQLLQHLADRDSVCRCGGASEVCRVARFGGRSPDFASGNGAHVTDTIVTNVDAVDGETRKSIAQRPEEDAPTTADVEQIRGGQVLFQPDQPRLSCLPLRSVRPTLAEVPLADVSFPYDEEEDEAEGVKNPKQVQAILLGAGPVRRTHRLGR